MSARLTAGLVVMIAGTLTFARASSGQTPTSGTSSVHIKPSSELMLRLPEVPYRYSVINLPVHFTDGKAQRFDNMPPDAD